MRWHVDWDNVSIGGGWYLAAGLIFVITLGDATLGDTGEGRICSTTLGSVRGKDVVGFVRFSGVLGSVPMIFGGRVTMILSNIATRPWR